jgi:manganese oxidase
LSASRRSGGTNCGWVRRRGEPSASVRPQTDGANTAYIAVKAPSTRARRGTEDQGHKAFNYRSERLDALLVEDEPAPPGVRARSLAIEPATPVFEVPAGAAVRLHLVVAADKPRNHAFALHGHGWREWPHHARSKLLVSSEGALTSGTARTYEFRASERPGDYAYRSGVHKWAIAQGLWGLLRVTEGGACR